MSNIEKEVYEGLKTVTQKPAKVSPSFLSRESEETTTSPRIDLQNGLETHYQKLVDVDESTTFSVKELLTFAPGFYTKSIPLVFNRICPQILSMVSLYYISYFEDPVMTAGFGMGHSLFMFFFMMFTITSCETAGILCSIAYGAQDFHTMRLQFYRGLMYNILIAIFAICMFVKTDLILIGIGLDETMSRNAHMMVQSMIPALILQACNEMTKNLLISQGIYKPFLYINLFIYAMLPIGGYCLIWKSGLGIAGFGIFKFLVELTNFIGIAILQKYKAHSESIKREPLSEIFNSSFCKYCSSYFKVLLGWYADYLGFEFNTILIGLLHDNHAMAAWVSIMNISGLGFVIGSGMSMCMRTICATKIGENKNQEAKKYGKMCYILIMAVAITFGTCLSVFASSFASIYTNIPEVQEYLIPMIRIDGFVIWFSGIGACVATLLRVAGKACILSMLMGFNNLIVFDGLSFLFLYYFKLGPVSVMYSFLIEYCISILVGSFIVFKFDWRKIPKANK